MTLNPLANALYMQLVGSKDFNKAFHRLQKLFSQVIQGDEYKIDNETYLRLVDLTCGILPFPNFQKLALLNEYKVDDRSILINEMMSQLIQILEIYRPILHLSIIGFIVRQQIFKRQMLLLIN